MQWCEKCGKRTTSRKDRFCQRHAKAELKRLADLGYFEPLTEVTISGQHKLSKHRFLTQPTSTGASETN